MAETLLKIKRSGTSGNPSKLRVGELAYSWSKGEGGNRLYIGTGEETDGNAANHAVIGGTYFTDMLDHTAGTLTAGSAIIVDADSKINEIKTQKISNDAVLTIQGTKTVLVNPYIGDQDTTLDKFITDKITASHIEIKAGTGIEVNSVGNSHTIGIKATGVEAKQYGSATKIPVLTVNAQGQVTLASEAEVATTLNLGDGTPEGAGSVDLKTEKLEVAAGTGVKVSLAKGKFTISADEAHVATKSYVDTQDQAMLASAKADAQAKATEAETNAKTYADTVSAKALEDAKADASTKDAEILKQANTYTDTEIPKVITSKVGTELQAHSAELDKVAKLATDGLVKRSDDGTWSTVKSTVAAGAYTKVTVDANGIVTKGENPTTLEDYGITNAVKKAGDTLDGKLTYAGSVNVDSFTDKDLVSKEYVDHVASGHIPHKACATGSKENIAGTYNNGTNGVGATLTTTVKNIGGVEVKAQDRVILLGQTKKSENGVYLVTSVDTNVVLTRAVDLDGSPTEEIYQGSSFLVAGGALQGTIWSLMNKTIVFGTDEIEFAQTAAPNIYTAGAGVSVSGNTIAVKQGATVKVIGGNLEVASGNDNTGKVLKAGANGTAATWGKLALTETTGTLGVARGGTGATTLPSNQLLVGAGTEAVKAVTNAEGVLVGSTVGAPTFGKADLTKHVSGILAPANGGTGVANTNTLTLAGGNITLTATAETSITLPTTGTLATLAGAETLSNKVIKAKNVAISDVTDATTAATGALTVAGGVGIAKNLHVGGKIVGAGQALEGFILDGGVY